MVLVPANTLLMSKGYECMMSLFAYLSSACDMLFTPFKI